MWVNADFEYTLLRERIADAQQRAATNHLLRGVKPFRTRRGVWEFVSRLLDDVRNSRRERRSISVAPRSASRGHQCQPH